MSGATRRIVRHSKGYLRDSGLLHHLLRIPDMQALLSHPRMGASWECMVMEEIIRQLNCRGAGFDYSYYRTSGGAEVDLVLEDEAGLVAVEIKYGQDVDWRAARTLRSFVDERKARLGLVINNDIAPRLLDDRIVSVPFACL